MNILNTHNHRLVFYLDMALYPPEEYIDRWKDFKLKCESGESSPSTPGPNKYIIEQMKLNCKLNQNKELPYLNRTEGGLGGNDNRIHKQIRFRDCILWSHLPNYKDNNIIFNEIISTNIENWTYEELDDIIYGFIKTANEIMKSECINGFIELKNKNGYLDSSF